MDTPSPPPHLVQRVERLMARRTTTWRHPPGGYSTAERWAVTFEDGSSVFVKSGEAHLATFLRAEHDLVYSRLRAPFLPGLVAWDDDGVAPVLVLEDLSDALWPPPWRPGQVEAVLSALETLQTFDRLLTGVPPLESHAYLTLRSNWQDVAADPAPFLGLGLCTPAWLRDALPVLQQASEEAPLEGNDLLHLDIRSDNLCSRVGQAVLVDWNHLCRGPRDLDVAAWLPSLHSEGGPPPEEVYPLAPCWPALVAGYFAARAGLPPYPQAPLVRDVQLSQLQSALPWAARALGLPAPDGPRA